MMKRILSAVVLLLLAAAPALAQKTIDQLGAGTAIGGTEKLPMFQGSNPAVTTTPNALKTFIGGGTVTSIATGCQATGGTITTSGTISTSVAPTDVTGANPAITTGYCGGLENLDNASPQVPTIAVAGSAGFASGWYTDLCNINTGSQTITPASGTIGGASTYVLAAGTAAAPKCVRIISDGVSNYLLVFPPGSGGSASGANPTATASDAAVNGSASTFMRSDAAPAIQKATSAQFGLAEADNTSILATAGVLSLPAFTGDCTTTAGAVVTTCNNLTRGPNYQATLWYLPIGSGGQAVTGSPYSTSKIACSVGIIPTKLTISQLGIVTKTPGSSNAQLAVYKDASGRPGALIAATGNIANTGGAGAITGALSGNKQVGPGGSDYNGRVVWFCVESNDTTWVTTMSSSFENAPYTGSTTPGHVWNQNAAPPRSINCSTCGGGGVTFGTWPDLTTGSTWVDDNGSGYGATIMFLVNSVP